MCGRAPRRVGMWQAMQSREGFTGQRVVAFEPWQSRHFDS